MFEENELEDPIDRLLADEPELVIPTPHGVFQPQQGIGQPEPIPEASVDNMVCLRGPCKHYMEAPRYFEAGNPAGSLEKVPQIINRLCLKIVPPEDLTDSVIHDCNMWEPISSEEKAKRYSDRVNWCNENERKDW